MDQTEMPSAMRTLVVTQQAPYPPLGGVELRNWQNINALMKLGSVAVFSIANFSAESQHLFQHPPGVAFWEHHYLNKSTTQFPFWRKGLWRFLPRRHFVTDWFYDNQIEAELNRVMAEFQPTLVVLEELLLYRYLLTVKRYGCPVIFDNHNAEAALFMERQPTASKLKPLDLHLQQRKIEAIERDFIHQADQIWACSNADAELLQRCYKPATQIWVIPNGIDVNHYDSLRAGTYPLPEGWQPVPQTLIFPANFRYPPNQVAAQLLITDIFPQVQQIYPHSRLILAGKAPNSLMLEAAAQNPDIIVTGFVEDMSSYLAASSIVVVPLQQGGGTRLKILEAFAAGRPVVSTDKGAEGIKAQDGEHLLIRNTEAEMVSGICELWEDAALGQHLAKNAYELAQAQYSWEAIARDIEQSVKALTWGKTSMQQRSISDSEKQFLASKRV
jgi:glycosyltransferase involved in cell wall biosynthesis